MKAIVLCVVGVAVSVPRAAAAQGIDCFKAANPVQKIICTDSNLMALDTSMASAYTQVPAASGARYMDKTVSVWNKGKEIAFDAGGKSQPCTEK